MHGVHHPRASVAADVPPQPIRPRGRGAGTTAKLSNPRRPHRDDPVTPLLLALSAAAFAPPTAGPHAADPPAGEAAAVPAEPNPVVGMVRQTLGKHAERPFILLVELAAKPGRGPAVVAAWRTAAAATRGEPGNTAYALHRDPGNPEKLVLWERWQSAAALESHMGTDYVTTLLETWAPLLAGPPKLTVLRAVPVKNP